MAVFIVPLIAMSESVTSGIASPNILGIVPIPVESVEANPQSIKNERMIKMFKSKYANLPECMSKFDENGVRTETRIRIAHYKTQEEVDALAAEGFVAHTDADFDKYLGNNTDGKTYRYDADTNAPKEYVHV